MRLDTTKRKVALAVVASKQDKQPHHFLFLQLGPISRPPSVAGASQLPCLLAHYLFPCHFWSLFFSKQKKKKNRETFSQHFSVWGARADRRTKGEALRVHACEPPASIPCLKQQALRRVVECDDAQLRAQLSQLRWSLPVLQVCVSERTEPSYNPGGIRS